MNKRKQTFEDYIKKIKYEEGEPKQKQVWKKWTSKVISKSVKRIKNG